MSGHPPGPPDGSAPGPAMAIPTGTAVLGLQDEPLGQVAAVYADNATGHPAWAAVQGVRHTTVVPMELSRYDGTALRVPFHSEQLRTAPVHDPSALISYEQGDALARHYGLIPPAPAEPVAPAAADPVSPAPVSPELVSPAPVSPAPVFAEPVAAAPVAAEPVVAELVAAVGPGAVGPGDVGPRSAESQATGDGGPPVTHVITEDRTFTVTVRHQEAVPMPDVAQPVAPSTVPAEEVQVVHAEPVLITTRVVPIDQAEQVRHTVIGERVDGQPFGAGDPVLEGQDDPFPPVAPQET